MRNCDSYYDNYKQYKRLHWPRLVKNIGWANQNIGGRRWWKVINPWAFLNYWRHVPGLPPKSTPVNVSKVWWETLTLGCRGFFHRLILAFYFYRVATLLVGLSCIHNVRRRWRTSRVNLARFLLLWVDLLHQLYRWTEFNLNLARLSRFLWVSRNVYVEPFYVAVSLDRTWNMLWQHVAVTLEKPDRHILAKMMTLIKNN